MIRIVSCPSLKTGISRSNFGIVSQRPPRTLLRPFTSCAAFALLRQELKSKDYLLVGQETRTVSSFASIDDEIRYANYKQDKVIIRTTPDRGYGVFAQQNFERGDLVMRAKALYTTDQQDKYTIQIDWNAHVYMDLPARFANHCCEHPTVGIQVNSLGAYDFVALDKISAGQEIVWDYETTEFEIKDFPCCCGSPTCREHLKGFRHHEKLVLEANGRQYVAPYLLQQRQYNQPLNG